MRIPDNNSNSMLEKYLIGTEAPKKSRGVDQSSSAQETPPSGGQGQADQVQISPQAQEIAKLHQIVASSSDLTADKVSQIQKQVSDGTYSVDPSQVAKKLVNETILNQIL